jgi:hypothetical protein
MPSFGSSSDSDGSSFPFGNKKWARKVTKWKWFCRKNIKLTNRSVYDPFHPFWKIKWYF